MKERMRMVRKDMGMTQQELADYLGTPKTNIVNYELGRRNPVSSYVSLFCSKCNVNETWLLTGEGEMHGPASREQEIAQITADLYDADPDGTMYKFMKELSKLKPETWKDIGNFINKVASRSDEPE